MQRNATAARGRGPDGNQCEGLLSEAIEPAAFGVALDLLIELRRIERLEPVAEFRELIGGAPAASRTNGESRRANPPCGLRWLDSGGGVCRSR